MKIGVVVFPGSNCDQDAIHVLRNVIKVETRAVWHKDHNVADLDAVILPGGFSYGDYLRCGAIAQFSPVMKEIVQFAKKGKPVLGICNGFQILVESGLLPGALIRNKSLHFECRHVNIRVETTDSPFLSGYQKNQVLNIPIAHGEGNYFADQTTLKRLNDENRVMVRYVNSDGETTDAANPNGSMQNIAGICNETRNVMGLMPHPERASEASLGSEDGRAMFESLMKNIAAFA